MNANFARRTRGDVNVTFATSEFQADWAIYCKLAIEAAFYVRM